jgi:hypothetical protein
VVEEERDEERHGARVEEGSTQRAKGKRRQSRYRVVGFATGEEINVSDEEETKMILMRSGWAGPRRAIASGRGREGAQRNSVLELSD